VFHNTGRFYFSILTHQLTYGL